MTKPPYHRQNLAAAIQQQARQQLENQGVAQISLRQIAKFLAVTPAAVYRHFPDKASLIAALGVEIQAEFAAALREDILASADATAMLHRMVTNLSDYAQDHPQAVTFYLTRPQPVPQSLTTVITLLAAQEQLTTAPTQLVRGVWTFLLGVLVQGATEVGNVEWITQQLVVLIHQ